MERDDPEFNVFIKATLKLDKPRKHKLSKSWGVYDVYKYIRKNKWFNLPRTLSEGEFYKIIRTVNKYLAECFIESGDLKFPCKMGKLELRKTKPKITFRDGKIYTTLPIDWKGTLKLWYEDKASRENKCLLRQEEKELFKILYNKSRADYSNKSFYKFQLNRNIKKKLKEQIKEGRLDAFLLYE